MPPEAKYRTSVLTFDLTHPDIVTVVVEDSDQNVVEVLVEGRVPKGHHEIEWSHSCNDEYFFVFDTATRHRLLIAS